MKASFVESSYHSGAMRQFWLTSDLAHVLKHEIMAPSSQDPDFLEVLQVNIGAYALFELFFMIFNGIIL